MRLVLEGKYRSKTDHLTVYHCERGQILKLDLVRLQTAEVNFSKPTQWHRLFLRKAKIHIQVEI